MRKHPFAVSLLFYVALTLAHPLGCIIVHPASPTFVTNTIQWVPVLISLGIAPVAFGLFSNRLFPAQGAWGRALRLFAIVGLGALIRPYWWALMMDHDFTFDHEPEVEFEVTFIEFFLAGFGFIFTVVPRQQSAA